MSASLEFLLGLLERDYPAYVAQQDLGGPHRATLAAAHKLGFLGGEPGRNPTAACPYCGEGVPYRLGDRHLCNRCHSTIDPKQLRLWRFDLEAFLRWLASKLKL